MVIIQYTDDKQVKKFKCNHWPCHSFFVQLDFWWFSLFVSEKSMLRGLVLLGCFFFFFFLGFWGGGGLFFFFYRVPWKPNKNCTVWCKKMCLKLSFYMHKKNCNRIYLINLRIHLVQIINTEKILKKKKHARTQTHTHTHTHTSFLFALRSS